MNKKTVESLYTTKKEGVINVKGVEFKTKILTGVEYLDVIDEVVEKYGVPKKTVFFKELIKRCDLKPEVDVDRLDAGSLILMYSAIEALHGGSGITLKNLNLK
ncbi:MAG: hypothetical protein DRN17_07135 [Thermoplasmata archaeon]|nr:MAG: hypothetical protein DRN17_07135 [Thermoplasmata archaeon]